MKFRYKLIIAIMLLLGLSFGIGGTILINRSFNSSLSYATDSYLQNYQNVQNTLLIAAEMSTVIRYDDLSSILAQLSENNKTTWANLYLNNTANGEAIFTMGTSVIPREIEFPEENKCISLIWNEDDSYYYQLSSIIKIKQSRTSNKYFETQLDIIYDITSIYNARFSQQKTFRILLITIFLTGGILSAILSYFLTQPLEQLSKMAQLISQGELTARANIHSGDEIEYLARNFNIMADTIEGNISELQASMDKQEQFMGSFAHELKTPMTSIIGYADLLRTHSMSADETSEAVNYIFSEGKRLESLSLKLLDLLVAKNQETILIKSNPANAIQNVINIMKPELAKENIILKSTCRKGCCMLDNDLFQSLIINIIDNARKAMDNGGMIHVAGTTKNDNYIIIIKDNGRGMPPEELARISEAFYRIDKSRSRAQGGAGLGLAICTKIAEIHNATLKFKSEVGRGTVVTITLSLAKEDEQP